MGWLSDHYRLNDDGFEDQDEYEEAIDNGDIKLLFNGSGWDPETDTEYWSDGTKK